MECLFAAGADGAAVRFELRLPGLFYDRFGNRRYFPPETGGRIFIKGGYPLCASQAGGGYVCFGVRWLDSAFPCVPA